MVSFRRIILALAVLALFVGLASAQVGTGGTTQYGTSLQCTATAAVTPQLRAEGVTELIGDILLTCTGSTPVPPANGLVPTANIVVSLGTQVTSRILASGNVSEALLLIDEPGSALQGPGPALPQAVCSSPTSGVGIGSTCVGSAPGALGLYYNQTAGAAQICASVNTGGASCGTFGTQGPNVYQGIVNSNQVTFFGVPMLAPVTQGFTRIFRITNVRANASGIGGGIFNGTVPISASIAISGSTSLPVTNPVLTTGFIQPGLGVSVRNAANSGGLSGSSGNSPLSFLQCNGQNSSSSGLTGNGPGATLRFSENFGTAFKTRVAPTATTNGLYSGPFTAGGIQQNIPGAIYNSESGFILNTPANASQLAGLADFGTRLRAVFTNIPSGVSIFVSTSNMVGGSYANGTFGGNNGVGNTTLAPSAQNLAFLVSSETAPDFNGQAPIVNPTNTIAPNTALYNVPLTATANGLTGEAVWEVVAANPSINENYDFGIWFQYTANPGGGSPSLGSGRVNMSFAPAPGFGPPPNQSPSTSYLNASSGPIPRFVDSSSASTLITISTCSTTLLFPYITNDSGFETGLSIANTTKDTFGTGAQNGTCALTLYAGDPNNATWNTTANAANASTVAPCTTVGLCLFNTNPGGTKAINAGNSYTATLSTIAGGTFQGYAIATCTFQYAHGFAFISDVHATNLAMGYLAIVVNGGAQLSSERGIPAEGLNH
jgi:hypothetical protein